jgi:hypothetical protein
VSRRTSYTHRFIETLPDNLDEGVLFVSVKYSTCAHRCMCGCGREVVTPIHPTKWILIFDGVTVSLKPSIGSWSLACQSHYWLNGGQVIWVDLFSDEEIDAVRARDVEAQNEYYKPRVSTPEIGRHQKQPSQAGWWQRMMGWLQGS